jgi:hypothetical protein
MRWPAVLSVDKPFAVMQAGVNIAHNFIDCDAPDWGCRLFTLQERLDAHTNSSLSNLTPRSVEGLSGVDEGESFAWPALTGLSLAQSTSDTPVNVTPLGPGLYIFHHLTSAFWCLLMITI